MSGEQNTSYICFKDFLVLPSFVCTEDRHLKGINIDWIGEGCFYLFMQNDLKTQRFLT